MPSGVLKEITAEDRSYYMASDIMALLGIDDAGSLGVATIYYAEERNDLR